MDLIEKNACCGCSACYNICPKNAISMVEDDKGFKYPKIDNNKCIECGMCKKSCPVLNKNNFHSSLTAYACYNKNEDERLKSSSGGIFVLLAKEILKKGGVVFGAYLNSELKVEHIGIEKEEDLIKLQGSKYVQSNIGVTYKIAKKYLEDGRYVLFSGTPCQIEGLKLFLGKDYDKLYCQDIVCHGVPSPKVWEKYKEFRRKRDNQIPRTINFRNKDEGWSKFNIKFEYEFNSYSNNLNSDLFLRLFLENVTLRDSCYNCSFKNECRDSDITLADYWGINSIHPDMYDNKGTSLMLIRSDKGRELFNKISDKIIYKRTKLNKAINYNSAMVVSVKKNSQRENFFKNLDKCDFEELFKVVNRKGEKISGIEIQSPIIINKIYNNFLDDISKSIFINRIMWEITEDKKYIREVLNNFDFIKEIFKNNNKKIIIFGAGYLGKVLYNLFDNLNWECFVDNSLEGQVVDGLKTISAKELKECYNDIYIVITPKNGSEEIYNQLKKMGFKDEQLINLGKILAELDEKRINDNILNEKPIFIETKFEIDEQKLFAKLKDMVNTKKIPMAISINDNSQYLLDIPNLLLKINPDYRFLLRNYSLDKYDTVLYCF